MPAGLPTMGGVLTVMNSTGSSVKTAFESYPNGEVEILFNDDGTHNIGGAGRGWTTPLVCQITYRRTVAMDNFESFPTGSSLSASISGSGASSGWAGTYRAR